MAVAFVKRAVGQTATSVSTLTATLPSAPDVGSLLVFTMAGDKNCGALTLAGFTQVYALTASQVSLYYCYKISDGSETSISPSWATTAVNGNTYQYAEYDDSAISGSTWQISAQASHTSDDLNYTSWSTGTTGTVSAAGLAIAMMALDSADSVVDGTTAWTNSYTPRYTTLASAGARGAIHIAEKTVSSGTTETTFSFTASTASRDQLTGAVVVFTKVSSDTAVSARLAGAASLYAVTEQTPTPNSRLDTGAHLTAVTTKNITPGSMLAAGTHLSAVVGHTATVEARLDSGSRLTGILTAGPNDAARDARLTAGAHLRAVVAQTFPAPVPAVRTYRITVPPRVYEIPSGGGMSLTKTFLADESDDLDYRYDWSRVLEDGETIIASVIEPPDGITAHGQVNGTETTDVWFTGGTPGHDYLIPNRITTSAGRTYERNIELKVRDR